MSEERRTTAQYMRQVVEHVRSRWKAPGTTLDASLLRPVDVPSMNAVFPRLTDVQLQRLFGDDATSTLPSDVCDVLENMERMCQKLT